MRRKTVLKHRVYVRRNGPRPAFVLALLVVAALIAFMLYARPAISRLALDLNQAPVASERVTRDVAFDALSLYLVELAQKDDLAGARIEAARYVPRGAAGYVYENGGAYLVIGAGYSTQAEADKVAAQLGTSESIATAVHPLMGEAALLRVTATEAQLSALIEGEQTLRALGSALSAHALSLDRGELQPAALRATLSIEAEQANAALMRLQRAAGDQPNAVAAALIERMATLTDACRRLSSEETDTALTLSSKIKYTFLDVRVSHIAFLNTLAA